MNALVILILILVLICFFKKEHMEIEKFALDPYDPNT